ncbi:hypothetical protein AB2M62_17040 [Sphingomonas sp. MMS12-HWE2-04]|uniref:hypothetical protein n=1 Tax=Sphingomonas sp. MMS12-HWE2-04 TaxID=3234199 RepID=UPI00384E398F
MLWIALTLTCIAGWTFKAHCVPGGWTDAEQYSTGCYNDVMPFWTGRGVKQGEIPYFQARMEYPVLTGARSGSRAPPPGYCSAGTRATGISWAW